MKIAKISHVKIIAKKQAGLGLVIIAAYTIWVALISIGHLVLFEYEMTASPLADTKRIFPMKSKIRIAHGRQNIIVFLHPCCPCSDATVEEFRQLMREGEKDSVGTVVFYMPPKEEGEWSLRPIITSVKRIRNVSVVYDTDGSQAALFGATTSGHVLVYDGRGLLQFSGGITGSRGHAGENHNFDVAKNSILAKNPKFATAPVFGCSLRTIQ